MGEIRIVADSTCDLSKDLIAKYNIAIVPLCVVLGDDSYYDGIDITPEEMYKWADENKTTPKTSAVTFEMAEKVLGPIMDNGDDIIFFGISEDMSTTCNVIRLYAEERDYKRLFVVDSMNLSTGIGLQVIRAAKLAEMGKNAEAIVKEIEGERDKVRASFIVDTLTYLARGGRCNSVTALLGNVLKLHPEIVVRDGKMSVNKKYRGKLNVVLMKYAKDHEEELKNADKSAVFITHSGLDDETVAEVKKYLRELSIFDHVYVTRAGGVISSHCGPGTLGILYYVK